MDRSLTLRQQIVFALVCALLTAAAYVIAFGTIYGPFAFAIYWLLAKPGAVAIGTFAAIYSSFASVFCWFMLRSRS
jgi:hypothetical protein